MESVTQLTLHYLVQIGRHLAPSAVSGAVALTSIGGATKLRWYLALNAHAKFVLVTSLAAE
ncbi:hypothetical protein, partial [Paenarthrobacter ureafaciens]|uniref:hypothetical protein n=1 Tax=Paenarthrobacter ureafaciens TaxID=37931 RepID=UPI001D17983D